MLSSGHDLLTNGRRLGTACGPAAGKRKASQVRFGVRENHQMELSKICALLIFLNLWSTILILFFPCYNSPKTCN